MTTSESEPRSSNRPVGGSHQPAPAGPAPKRTLNECVNDILAYICNRFGNPSDFEQLIQELDSLIPTTFKG